MVGSRGVAVGLDLLGPVRAFRYPHAVVALSVHAHPVKVQAESDLTVAGVGLVVFLDGLGLVSVVPEQERTRRVGRVVVELEILTQPCVERVGQVDVAENLVGTVVLT